MNPDLIKLNTINPDNISKINIKSQNEKKKRKKISWTEREEKTLFILQMALGSKFSIIQAFIKDKTVNEIKNHFYSKLRTYLGIQLTKLKAENFFKEISPNTYNIKKILSLVLSNKIPTMILCKNIIKELILKEEQKNKNKNNSTQMDDVSKEKKKKVKLGKKRGSPSKKNSINKSNNHYKIIFGSKKNDENYLNKDEGEIKKHKIQNELGEKKEQNIFEIIIN